MTQEHTYLRLHELSGRALHLNIREKALAIMEEARLAGSGRAAETLVKEGPLRVTILGFTAGSIMHEHRADGPVGIEVLDGVAAVSTDGGAVDVGAGEIMVVDTGVPHSVVAKADSAVLLWIALNSHKDGET